MSRSPTVAPLVKKTDSPAVKQAYIAVLLSEGYSYRQISRMLGVSGQTITEIKRGLIVPDEKLMKSLESQEINRLRHVGFLATEANQRWLEGVLDGNQKHNPIASTAIQDRSFQQRRTLEGEASIIYDMKGNVDSSRALMARIKELQAEVAAATRSIDLQPSEDGTYQAPDTTISGGDESDSEG